MNEEQKKEVAVFRFGIIHDFVNGVKLDRGEQERLLKEKCGKRYVIPHSPRTHIGRSTILRWIKAYHDSNGKIEALYPRDRSDRGVSRGLDEDTSLALIRLREEKPKSTVPDLISTMYRREIVPGDVNLNLSTVYRFMHSQGLMERSLSKPEDRRKYEAEFPNDIWQSDAMHGPMVESNGRKRKSYLLAFIDDQSRLVPHGEFYFSEGLSSYMQALEQALMKRGLPRKLYLDNGPAFRSKHLEHVTASLGIALIHARPYKPQGKGKIERFFRTVRMQFLTGFRGESLYDLNETFDLWLNDVYHRRKHSSTGESPFSRFTSHMECIRTAPKDIRDYFRNHARRRVARDRSITLNGKLYEAPVSLIGKQVLLLYHDASPERIEVTYNHKSYGYLTPLDLHINTRVKRDRNKGTDIEPDVEGFKYRGGKLWTTGKEG